MCSKLLCLLGALLVVAGVHSTDIKLNDPPSNTSNTVTIQDLMKTDFPSKFLGNANNIEGILDLMQSHINYSLDYLHSSKIYGNQFNERPGMAKLLMEESDRHWEEGMNVLKKYLHSGGTTYEEKFFNHMNFIKGNDMLDGYKGSLMTMMGRSRTLGNTISDLYHAANHRPSAHGDADIAHFLAEKAEKESDVARKMVGHIITLEKMHSSGIAFEIFDKNL